MTKINFALITGLQIFIILSIITCGPITEEIPTPEILINSPAEGSYCANTVEIRGIIRNYTSWLEEAGPDFVLSYEVPNTIVRSNDGIAILDDGTFQVIFDAFTLPARFYLHIAITGKDTRQTVLIWYLRRKQGNSVPSFRAEAGTGDVTLDWEPVPNTVQYNVICYVNTIYPEEEDILRFPDVKPPCTINDLTNGCLYAFLLTAVPCSGWSASTSALQKCIPLAEDTLTPSVHPEGNRMIVQWPDIPGTNEYIVYRGGTESDMINISGVVKGTTFIDTETEANTHYIYRIEPFLDNAGT